VTKKRRGLYVVFEGGEAVGKTTTAREFVDRVDAYYTREPGGSPVAERIREIYQDPLLNGTVTPITEIMLLSASRCQMISDVVVPTLEAGKDIVSDRNWMSTVAYQGYGRGMDIPTIKAITKISIGEYMTPDITFVLHIPHELALERMGSRGRELDRMELAGDEFHQRVRVGYLELAQEFGAIIIDGAQTTNDIITEVMDIYSTQKRKIQEKEEPI
jgi:dTMP kinase